ncbi:MAG: NAD(P)/FAD-dependent oxidoreductase [Nitrospirales bacterium]|nr:NAD(P)/FAD-dependent oxidoreductase [Nitrospirales bacterium]
MAKRIVIVGGGAGGTITANLLARNLYRQLVGGQVVINMITDKPDHVYQPGFLYVVFDKVRPDELIRKQKDLLDPHINLFVDPAVKIDKENKVVYTASGRDFPYDYLVIATGSRIVPETIPGLKEGGHWFYDLEGAKKLRDALRNFEGGRVVITVGVPHKCPVAPLEITFMLYDYFRERGMLDKVELYYTYPINRLHALEPVANWALPQFEKKGIKSEVLFNMEEIDAEKKILKSMEGSEINYDLLIVVPPHKGAQVVIDSELGKDGWIPTNKKNLYMEGAEGVYVVGDTTNIPISKAGSTAHFESDVVAERISSQIHEGDSSTEYDGKVVCFVETGFNEATYVWFNYNTPPNPTPPSKMLHWMKLGYNRLYWLSARGIL